MATHPAPGICWAFVTFSSLRASCPLGGVARSHARGDATARGGERKLSLSSALEAACSRVPSLLASLAIIEEPALRVFFLGKLQSPSLGPGGSKKDPSQDNTPPCISIVCLLISWKGGHDTLFTRSRVKKRLSFWLVRTQWPTQFFS